MIPRFGFIKQKRGVWDVVKISTGPWIQYADHKQALAEKDRECGLMDDEFTAKMVRTVGELEQQNARLREALRNIIECEEQWTRHDMVREAKQAMKGGT